MTEPGWHDAPDGSPRLRYWNGAAWTNDYAPKLSAAPRAVSDRSTKWLTVGALIVGVMLLGWFFTVGGDDEAPSTNDAPTRTDPKATESPTSPASVQAPGCPPMSTSLYAEVTVQLKPGLALGGVASDNSGSIRWMVASIYDADGRRVSTADTWARLDSDEVVAISGSAREFSTLRDGREDLPDAFSDTVRQALEECVIAAL